MSDIYKYFKRSECLQFRDTEFPLSPELEQNLTQLLTCVNKFREEYNHPISISSLYRPGRYNVLAKGSTNSAHITCQAVDFVDIDNKLKAFVLANPGILEKCDLYMEDPKSTPRWVHLQTHKPLSGKRLFRP